MVVNDEKLKNLEIFRNGIKNFEDFKKNFMPQISKKKIKKDILLIKIKILVQIFIAFLFSFFMKNKKINEKIKIVYAKSHEKILNKKDVIELKWGRSLKQVQDIFSEKNICVYISIGDYIKNIFKYCKYLKLNEIIYFLEFLIFFQLVKENNIEKIFIAGHQDRIATWLSFLSYNSKTEFCISQHGIMTDIKVPTKIYANFVEVYNEEEKIFFENYLIKNNNCKYLIKGLENTLNLKITDIQGEKVGFFSQYGETMNTIRIIKKINEVFPNLKIFVSPHPLEEQSKFKELKLLKNVIVTNNKYINFDIIITYRSTIIYDYMSEKGFEGAVIAYPLDFKHKFAFGCLSKVKVVYKEKELLEQIENIYRKKREKNENNSILPTTIS